jgi:hypothetical protein
MLTSHPVLVVSQTLQLWYNALLHLPWRCSDEDLVLAAEGSVEDAVVDHMSEPERVWRHVLDTSHVEREPDGVVLERAIEEDERDCSFVELASSEDDFVKTSPARDSRRLGRLPRVPGRWVVWRAQREREGARVERREEFAAGGPGDGAGVVANRARWIRIRGAGGVEDGPLRVMDDDVVEVRKSDAREDGLDRRLG